MLRLVCCDVDGTLLPAGETRLSEDTTDILRRLTDKGITVAIASGRPYSQVKSLFPTLTHRLVFLCLDGAITLQKDCVLHKRPLPRTQALTLLSRYPDAVVHGRETAYRLGHAAGAGRPVASSNEIGESFLKIELPTGAFAEQAPWHRVAYRSDTVTELVASCANKGNAIATLMEKFGISPDQAVAFGDGENDIELLKAVGHPYLMATSALRPAIPNMQISYSVAATLLNLFF